MGSSAARSDVDVDGLVAAARNFIGQHRHSPASMKTYRGYWQRFAAWCDTHDRTALPADVETVLAWLGRCVARRRSSGIGIEPALAAISRQHAVAGLCDPTKDLAVRQVRDAVRTSAEVCHARPLSLELLAQVPTTSADSDSSTWRRDRDICIVGVHAALSSANLRGLHTARIDRSGDSAVIAVPRPSEPSTHPGDPVELLRWHGHRLCPIAALDRLLADAPPDGPLLESPSDPGHPVSHIVIARAVANVTATLPTDRTGRRFTTNSLRAGFAATARAQGASPTEIAFTMRILNWDNAHHGHRDDVDGIVTELLERIDRNDG